MGYAAQVDRVDVLCFFPFSLSHVTVLDLRAESRAVSPKLGIRPNFPAPVALTVVDKLEMTVRGRGT